MYMTQIFEVILQSERDTVQFQENLSTRTPWSVINWVLNMYNKSTILNHTHVLE